VTPREAILRAYKKLGDAVYDPNAAPPKVSQCEDWQATIKKHLPDVPTRNSGDISVNSMRYDEADGMVAVCFARANECDRALRLFRERSAKQRLPEAETRKAYAQAVADTPCKPR
jgi:hypothetical protein